MLSLNVPMINFLVLTALAALIAVALLMSRVRREPQKKTWWKMGALHAAGPFLISLLIALFHPLTVYILVLGTVGALAALSITALWIMQWKHCGSGWKTGVKTAGFWLATTFGFPFMIFVVAISTYHRSPSPWWLLIGPFGLSAVYLERNLKETTRNTVELARCLTLPQAGGTGLRIAHLSDLHVCTDETMEKALPAQRVLRAVRDALKWAMAQEPNFVVVTGDVTDSGLETQWQAFDEILAGLTAEQIRRIILVPGNHDLSIPWEMDRPFAGTEGDWILHFEERCFSYFHHVVENAPAHWKVFLAPTSELPLPKLLEQVAGYLHSYRQAPPRLGHSLKDRRSQLARMGHDLMEELSDPRKRLHHSTHPWRKPLHEYNPPVILDPRLAEADKYSMMPWPKGDFPLVQDLLFLGFPIIAHEDAQYVVVVLNSNVRPALSVADGALGTLGDHQLKQLEALLESRVGKCVIILIHHHLGCPKDILSQMKLSLKVLQLNEANRLCDLLAKHGPAVVLHGHKHLDYRATYKDVMILSAASVAYGDALRRGSENCHIYDIEADGRVLHAASTGIAAS